MVVGSWVAYWRPSLLTPHGGHLLKSNNNNINPQAAAVAEEARASTLKASFGSTVCPGLLSHPSFHFTVTRVGEGAFGSSSGSFQEDTQFYVSPGLPSESVSLLCVRHSESTER